MTPELPAFLHFGTIALTVGINSVGVGIGEGLASNAALKAINIQPKAHTDILKTVILGMALIETAAIMGITISMILLFGTKEYTLYGSLAETGIALATCCSGLVLGLVSALPVQQACYAVARQPFFTQKIVRFMLITQSLIQTPIIFGFIVAMLIRDQAASAQTLADSLRLIASGLCIGLGSIGPAFGLAEYAKTACRGLGINRSAYNQLLSFTFISQAIIETPIIFAMVISLLLLFDAPPGDNLFRGIAMFSAALCTSLGTIGPGISS